MLKNHRNRACVLRFESKFIYLTCRQSASFFGNFVWRPPRSFYFFSKKDIGPENAVSWPETAKTHNM
jgi:hypothetical protein